jgi:hypothetical protein
MDPGPRRAGYANIPITVECDTVPPAKRRARAVSFIDEEDPMEFVSIGDMQKGMTVTGIIW